MAEYREEPSLPSQWDFLPLAGIEPKAERPAPRVAARSTHTVTVEVPKDFLTWIGRMTVQWAHLQWLLSGVACKLLGVRRQDAQILLELPDKELPNKILRLFSQKQIRAPSYFPVLAALLRECEEAVALLQNGVWIKEADTEQLRIHHPAAQQKVISDALGKPSQSDLRTLTQDWFVDIQSKMERAASAIQELDQHVERAVR